MAMKGARVVLLNRPSERATAAEKKIQELVPDANVSTIDCDLSSFASTRKAAEKLKSEFAETGIDCLCCNAAVMAAKDKATEDGYDIQMQTNHLSHFLLTKECWPLLEKAAARTGEARVVHHSSGARNLGGVLERKYLGKNGGNLGGDGNSMFFVGARWKRYAQSKNANAVFTMALRDKINAKGLKIKALCANPGLAASELQATTDKDGGMGSGVWFMKYGQSSEDGAMSLINCCCMPNMKNGDCLEPKQGATGLPTNFYPDKEWMGCATPASRQLLWEESEKAVGKFDI